jgi:opacity protein-like surface antigen
MKSFFLRAVALGGLFACAQAHAQWEFHAAAGLRHAGTTETNRDGKQLVNENGTLPGIEAGAAYRLPNWTIGVSGEIYRGDLGYDGRTQTGAPFSTDTGTTQSRITLEVMREISDGLSLVGALAWDYWRRDIAGRATVLGLSERYDSWRVEAGIQARLAQYRFGALTARGSLLLSAPEKLEVRFEQGVFDPATLRTEKGTGARLALGLQRLAGTGVDLEADYEWLRIPRSDDAPLRRNGIVAGSVAQPEHVRSAFGIKAIYRF